MGEGIGYTCGKCGEEVFILEGIGMRMMPEAFQMYRNQT